jgi:DNA-binding Lrp family transcriptional regulator
MAASYSLRVMAHALVLIKAEQQSLSSLGGALAEVEGVSEAFSVTGEWDFVAIVRVPDHDQLAEVVTERMAGLSGIKDTYTMVAYEVFSQHDLEAMFSIGE